MEKSISEEDWSNWLWQEKNRVTSIEVLKKFIPISQNEEKEVTRVLNHFIMSVTPYFLTHVSLLYDKGESRFAKTLTKTFLPSLNEISDNYFSEDGLGENGSTPHGFISQLYPDRVLLFLTHYCPFYCRYCFRRRKVILSPEQEIPSSVLQNIEKSLYFIKNNRNIRDVILSGGEPLSINDEQLENIIYSLRKIEHVKIIRIDTKIPAVMPMRITDKLVNMLKKYHPIFINLHFVHPKEIIEETKNACLKLVDAGIPLGTYTPILKGINDDKDILKELFWKLVQIRIRPYYLVQFVPTKHAEHFKVPLKKSLELLEKIHWELSGIAVPHFKVYIKGKGKVSLLPQWYLGKNQKGHLFKTWKGEGIFFEDPEKEDNG